MVRTTVHMALHGLVPLAVAWCIWPQRYARAFAAMMATMVVDFDHLWADPIFDPNRCSIGSHPLHSHLLCLVYGAMALLPATRVIGLGLTIHMLLDGIDCTWMRLE